ncbi:hypothetical protein DSECCO2_528590 [anaerobic digester metagenome]
MGVLGGGQRLAHELEAGHQGLEDAGGAHFVGAGAALDMAGDFPLGVDQGQGVQGHEDQDAHQCHEDAQELRVDHRSISGMTRSRLPRMDTASARSVPWLSSAKRLRFEKLGARSLTR